LSEYDKLGDELSKVGPNSDRATQLKSQIQHGSTIELRNSLADLTDAIREQTAKSESSIHNASTSTNLAIENLTEQITHSSTASEKLSRRLVWLNIILVVLTVILVALTIIMTKSGIR